MDHNSVLRPLRVLVVDDCEDTTSSLAWLIRAWGFEADEANSGPEALLCAAANAPDVALLDLMMPRMDGWAVARALRGAGGRDRLAVVILSGCNGPPAERNFPPTEYALHLRKPIDLEELRRFLTRSEEEMVCHEAEAVVV